MIVTMATEGRCEYGSSLSERRKKIEAL